LGTLRISNVESIPEMEAVSDLFCKVWAGGPEVVPFDLGLAVLHVGAYCAAAYDGDQMVAASFGFRGVFQDKQILHSHVTGSFQPGAGYALKLHQFDWAKSQGLSGITWSFDPLVRRNCVLNFDKLGATAVEYLPNFYGTMTDSINSGDESDRLFAFWDLSEAKKESKATDGAVLVELPADIESLRKTDLPAALTWRRQTRETLQPLLDQGWTISRMQDRTHLLVDPPK
jgi:predicted GNAT superfamily acetyltransferase